MTARSPSSTGPFVAGSMITDSRYFVGRREALNTITARMTGPQPTSINIVGQRRIGKSSLLYHFSQTYEQRVERYGKNPQNYLAVYLSLQNANCQNESSFYHAVAKKVRDRPVVQNNNVLRVPFTRRRLDRQTFSDALNVWRSHNVLLVLCLDKFEALLENKQEFDTGFYDNLRSLMDANHLMLVVASYKPLYIYSKKHKLNSSFFNVGHIENLTGLTETEAKDLVRLPDVKNPVLNETEQLLALKWGDRHPYLLQLAGICLWEAAQNRQSKEWAKEQFDQNAQQIPKIKRKRETIKKILRFLFWTIPLQLGNVIKNFGLVVNEVIAWGFGMCLMVLLVLAIVGWIPGNQVSHQFQRFVCGALSSALPEDFCQ